MSCLTTHRRDTQEGAECSKVREQTRVKTVLVLNVPRKIHASLGVLSCAQRCRTSHCALHGWRGILGKPALDDFPFSSLPARSLQTANPSAGAMHAPTSWPCLIELICTYFFDCSMLRKSNKPYDGRLYACQFASRHSTCHVGRSTLALKKLPPAKSTW